MRNWSHFFPLDSRHSGGCYPTVLFFRLDYLCTLLHWLSRLPSASGHGHLRWGFSSEPEILAGSCSAYMPEMGETCSRVGAWKCGWHQGEISDFPVEQTFDITKPEVTSYCIFYTCPSPSGSAYLCHSFCHSWSSSSKQHGQSQSPWWCV